MQIPPFSTDNSPTYAFHCITGVFLFAFSVFISAICEDGTYIQIVVYLLENIVVVNKLRNTADCENSCILPVTRLAIMIANNVVCYHGHTFI